MITDDQHERPGAASDAPSLIMRYLELLYDPRAEARAREGEPTAAAGLGPIDVVRLRAEREARHRNLRQALRRSLDLLMPRIDDEMQLYLVDRLCQSEALWQPRARSLGEALCLVAFRELGRAGHTALAELARLDGVRSGMWASDGPSPWPELGLVHDLRREAATRVESFLSPLPLVIAGRVPDTALLEALRPDQGPFRVTVTRASDYIATTVERAHG